MSNCFLYNQCNHIDCNKFCLRKFKVDYLYNEALLSETQRVHQILLIDSDGTDTQQFQHLKDIENNIVDFIKTGNNLYIYSKNCGNGKTSWALRLLQTYVNKIWSKSELTCRCLFINVPRFLLALKDNISDKSDYVQHIKDNVLNCDLVIWDEIGSKGLSQFEHEHILSMINARIDLNKSNIYTSNLSNEELHNSVGDRLYSRIVNYSDSVELFGADKRQLGRSK